jgi:hypothetical protein
MLEESLEHFVENGRFHFSLLPRQLRTSNIELGVTGVLLSAYLFTRWAFYCQTPGKGYVFFTRRCSLS